LFILIYKLIYVIFFLSIQIYLNDYFLFKSEKNTVNLLITVLKLTFWKFRKRSFTFRESITSIKLLTFSSTFFRDSFYNFANPTIRTFNPCFFCFFFFFFLYISTLRKCTTS